MTAVTTEARAARAAIETARRHRAGDHDNRPWAERDSFVRRLEQGGAGQLDELAALAEASGSGAVERALAGAAAAAGGGPAVGLDAVAALISPAAAPRLDELAGWAREATLRRFGRAIQLFAPLYLSNQCVNTCLYCGFSRENAILRRTLEPGEVEAEAELLAGRGFRHLLLVSAEHPRLVSTEYLGECLGRAARHAAAVAVEVQAQDEVAYRELRAAGCDGVVIYQETYDRVAYERLHRHGLKRDMDFRLDAPDRIGLAGVRQCGLGALLGLSRDWRREVLAVCAHALYLQRRHWRMSLTVALPRLRPAAGGFEAIVHVADREFAQALCALRLALPEAGIVLSTRERPALRDALVGVGVTHMSAGSSTEPGGYGAAGEAEAQFAIDDERAPAEVAAALERDGYEPVWKDWEPAL